MAVSWHEAWRARFIELMESPRGWARFLAEHLQEDREKTKNVRNPSAPVSLPVHYAVDIACVDPHHPFVRDFLRCAIESGEAILADAESWATRWAGRNLIHGELIEALAVAYALRDDSALDRALVETARLDAISVFNQDKGRYWDEVAQSRYLAAVQFCLAGGDLAGAAEMMNTKRRFRKTELWHKWLSGLIKNLTTGGGRLTDPHSIVTFNEFFDRIRNPNYLQSQEYEGLYDNGGAMMGELNLIALSMATIRHIYIDGGQYTGSWPKILKSISA